MVSHVPVMQRSLRTRGSGKSQELHIVECIYADEHMALVSLSAPESGKPQTPFAE